MANFKRKNKTHRAQVEKLDPCDNWSTTKSIQRITRDKKLLKILEMYND